MEQMEKICMDQSRKMDKIIASQTELARTNTNLVFDLQTANQNLRIS